MRETCARVLAAALMTGAIAFAVGMPALFGAAHDLGRLVLAPPSSLQRTIRVPASPAPSRPTGPQTPAGTQSAAARRSALLRSEGDRYTSPQSRLSGRQPDRTGKPAPKPKPNPEPKPQPKPEPSPAPQPGTRELASTSAAPDRVIQPAATGRPADHVGQRLHANKSKGKGKPKGHEPARGSGQDDCAATTQSTSTGDPAAGPPPSTSGQAEPESPTEHGNGQDQGNGNGHGNSQGNGQGKGHDKGHKG